MVKYEPSDLIDAQDFGFAWRLTGIYWEKTSIDPSAHLRFLSELRCQSLAQYSSVFRHQGPYALNAERFHASQSISLEKNAPDDALRLREWFAGLPIRSSEEVYVNWTNAKSSPAAVTTWEAVTELWDDLWYPFDVVNVFDETRTWAVLFGPEEYAVYARPGPAHQQEEESLDRNGFGLVRATPPPQ